MKKRILTLLVCLCMIASLMPVYADDAPVTVTEIQKYGNLVLSLPASELMAQGIAFGDVVTVSIAGQEYDMPVGSNYSDVDQGSMILRAVIKEESGEDYIILAINMGDLATTTGIATKEKTEEDPGYIWHINEGVEEPVEVTITLKEAGGYYDKWVMNQLVRSENREDYPMLSDAEYANFRMIQTTGVAEGMLYRSSSPVNPEINRNQEADEAACEAGIKTFINLADNEEVMKAYDGFDKSYYAAQNVIALNLGVDFSAEDFKTGLAEGLRFIAANEGPFLIHCNEGKDRAGFVSAVVESLMGASADEIVNDYMITFRNYYGVEEGTEQYRAIAASNIEKSLAAAFSVESIYSCSLQAEAEEYLSELGLSSDEIKSVFQKLH